MNPHLHLFSLRTARQQHEQEEKKGAGNHDNLIASNCLQFYYMIMLCYAMLLCVRQCCNPPVPNHRRCWHRRLARLSGSKSRHSRVDRALSPAEHAILSAFLRHSFGIHSVRLCCQPSANKRYCAHRLQLDRIEFAMGLLKVQRECNKSAIRAQ